MRKIQLWIKKSLEDLLFLAGMVAILIGTIQVNPLLAWFVGGAECLIVGFVLAWSKRK